MFLHMARRLASCYWPAGVGEASARLRHEIRGRRIETLGSVWTFLDITPLGRQEEWEDSPKGYPQTPPYGW
jgi:predicted dithiol-disulfide oxidoreductase (DUF899 family)